MLASQSDILGSDELWRETLAEAFSNPFCSCVFCFQLDTNFAQRHELYVLSPGFGIKIRFSHGTRNQLAIRMRKVKCHICSDLQQSERKTPEGRRGCVGGCCNSPPNTTARVRMTASMSHAAKNRMLREQKHHPDAMTTCRIVDKVHSSTYGYPLRTNTNSPTA